MQRSQRTSVVGKATSARREGVAFGWVAAQIDHASMGPNHLRVVVGQATERVAIVRVSGSQAGAVLTRLAGKTPARRSATRVLLRDASSQPIDDAVVLWFPGPASATGEDVAEFHIHGGRAVLASVFATLSAIENVRPAEPGEFTRRASRTASST